MTNPHTVLPRRLVVFTGCVHYLQNGRFVAHGGFVREMEIWARIFPAVLVVTVLGSDEPPADAIPYAAPGLACSVLGPAARTSGWIGKLRLIRLTAQWAAAALPLLHPGDIVMARGPDSVGFLGGLLARLKGLPRFAKYADQWQTFPGEPRGYRWQKAFYRSRWFGGPVQIYGQADPVLPHLVPCFTSSLSENEWGQAAEPLTARQWAPPWRILFCGRFVPAKGIDLLLRAFKLLLESGAVAKLELVGDGEEKAALIELSAQLGLQDCLEFHGWLGRDALLQQFSRAHILVCSSRKEGFGKVIIEAMAYGLPVIATDVGVSRWLLNPPECGALTLPESHRSLADQLIAMVGHPEQAKRMGLSARTRVRQFLLEKLEHQYREFLITQYGFSFA